MKYLKFLICISALECLWGRAALCAEIDQYDCSTADGREYCVDANQKPVTGKIKKYQSDGNFESIVNYRNGYPDGLATYFRPEGKLKERVYYKQGIKNGMDKIYYENRTIYQLLNYRNGILDGRQVFYTPNEKILGQADYNEGVLKSGFCMQYTDRKAKKRDFSSEEIKNMPYNQLFNCEAQ